MTTWESPRLAGWCKFPTVVSFLIIFVLVLRDPCMRSNMNDIALLKKKSRDAMHNLDTYNVGWRVWMDMNECRCINDKYARCLT